MDSAFRCAHRENAFLPVVEGAAAYARLATGSRGPSSLPARLSAVTGTKGKTTTVHLLASILREAGERAGLIATGVVRWNGQEHRTPCTTPGREALRQILSAMAGDGVDHVVLEASSMGLAQHRLDGIACDAAVWTNTGTDHLEYHGGRANYVAAKARLFTEHLKPMGHAVVNADDESAMTAAAQWDRPLRTYGRSAGGVRLAVEALDAEGMRLVVAGHVLHTRLVGLENAYNVCAAVAAAIAMGISSRAIVNGIGAVEGLAGRFERLTAGSVEVVVDYAHTPESVGAVLRTVRQLWPARRLATVLGAGGGTDRDKRGPMAAIAASLSDLLVLTEDNSRDEPLAQILADLAAGVSSRDRYEVVRVRGDAVAFALRAARPDGVLAVLGRGPEQVLITNHGERQGSDADLVRGALADSAARPC